MRVAFVLVKSLPVQLAVLDNPGLLHQPLVIGGSSRETRPVYDASKGAASSGVRPGLSLHQAYALCPEAIFLPADEGRYRQAMAEVTDVLDDFSPVVEVDGVGSAYIDITGVPKEEALAEEIAAQIYRRTRLKCCIGISDGRFFARVAALTTNENVLTVPPGGDKAFIASMPIDLLPGPAETLQRIRYLGLRTIGQLAGFPSESLVAQFGSEGARYHDLANGIDRTRLTPQGKPATVAVAIDLEPPATICLQVLYACQTVLQDPLEETRRQGKSCREMLVRVGFTSGDSIEGRLRFKQPTVSISHIQHRLHSWLDEVTFPSPVVRLELELTLTGEAGTNLRLWSGAMTPRQGTMEVARNLKERFGYQPLKQVRELDPDARLPERRFGLTDVQG